jgi:hypothetical protein
MKKLTVEIVSVDDRVNLVAEIWLDKILIAEINSESESLVIELYPTEIVSISFCEFIEALNTAKERLSGDDGDGLHRMIAL